MEKKEKKGYDWTSQTWCAKRKDICTGIIFNNRKLKEGNGKSECSSSSQWTFAWSLCSLQCSQLVLDLPSHHLFRLYNLLVDEVL